MYLSEGVGCYKFHGVRNKKKEIINSKTKTIICKMWSIRVCYQYFNEWIEFLVYLKIKDKNILHEWDSMKHACWSRELYYNVWMGFLYYGNILGSILRMNCSWYLYKYFDDHVELKDGLFIIEMPKGVFLKRIFHLY